MWKFCIIRDDFRIFYALKNPEIRKNPENSHAWTTVRYIWGKPENTIIVFGACHQRYSALLMISIVITHPDLFLGPRMGFHQLARHFLLQIHLKVDTEWICNPHQT